MGTFTVKEWVDNNRFETTNEVETKDSGDIVYYNIPESVAKMFHHTPGNKQIVKAFLQSQLGIPYTPNKTKDRKD